MQKYRMKIQNKSLDKFGGGWDKESNPTGVVEDGVVGSTHSII